LTLSSQLNILRGNLFQFLCDISELQAELTCTSTIENKWGTMQSASVHIIDIHIIDNSQEETNMIKWLLATNPIA
jgi:hypothetical protein